MDGAKIHEVKRISLDLGQRLFKSESTFTQDGKPVSLDLAIGVTTHGGKANVTLDPQQGSWWPALEWPLLWPPPPISPLFLVGLPFLYFAMAWIRQGTDKIRLFN